MGRIYVLFVLLVTASLFTSGLKFMRLRTFFREIKTSIKEKQWIRVLTKLDQAVGTLNSLRKRTKIDISAGYGSISSPDQTELNLELLSLDIMDDIILPKSPVLWAHQVGKRVVRKVPDTALLGVLVLIASELLRRGVNSNSDTLPPLIREFANATIIELDAKLEMLSSLEWKVDPFLRAELENLQTQPLEVIDKFIVTSILPSVDKDFAPFLLKYMVGDTKKVKTITQSLKDLIQLSMVLLEGSVGSPKGTNPLVLTTSTIIEQVDLVGQSIEEVVNDWNRIVVQFTGSMTELINTDSVINLINKQFLLNNKDNTSISLINNTFSYTPNMNNINTKININGNDNVKAQRTLLWNSKRPWNVLSSVDYIEEDNRNGVNSPVNNGNGNNGNGNKTGSTNAHNKNIKKGIIVDSEEISQEEDMTWNSLLGITKKKNLEKTFKSTTLLNNITKKPPVKMDSNISNNTSKKATSFTPSAFTSYLQDLMD